VEAVRTAAGIRHMRQVGEGGVIPSNEARGCSSQFVCMVFTGGHKEMSSVFADH
jgi:hypothetical protein